MSTSKSNPNNDVFYDKLNDEMSEILDVDEFNKINNNPKWTDFLRKLASQHVQDDNKIKLLNEETNKYKIDSHKNRDIINQMVQRYSIDINDFSRSFPGIFVRDLSRRESITENDHRVSTIPRHAASVSSEIKAPAIESITYGFINIFLFRIEDQKLVIERISQSYNATLLALCLKYNDCKQEISNLKIESDHKSYLYKELTDKFEKIVAQNEEHENEIKKCHSVIQCLQIYKNKYEQDYAPIYNYFLTKFNSFYNHLQLWENRYLLIKQIVIHIIDTQQKEKNLKSSTLQNLPKIVEMSKKMRQLEKDFDNYFATTSSVNFEIAIPQVKSLINSFKNICPENPTYDSVNFSQEYTCFNITYILALLQSEPPFPTVKNSFKFKKINEVINSIEFSYLAELLNNLKSFKTNLFQLSPNNILTLTKFTSETHKLVSIIAKIDKYDFEISSTSDSSHSTNDATELLLFLQQYKNLYHEYSEILKLMLNMSFPVNPKSNAPAIKIKSVFEKLHFNIDSYHKHLELMKELSIMIEKNKDCISLLEKECSDKTYEISDLNQIIIKKDKIFNEMSLKLIHAQQDYNKKIQDKDAKIKHFLKTQEKLHCQYTEVYQKLCELKSENINKKTIKIYNQLFTFPNITDYSSSRLPPLLTHEEDIKKLDFSFLKIQKNSSVLLEQKQVEVLKNAKNLKDKIIYSLENINDSSLS
ncbi:hypothetical protein HZS_8185, partial [Henneguya salminicola]